VQSPTRLDVHGAWRPMRVLVIDDHPPSNLLDPTLGEETMSSVRNGGRPRLIGQSRIARCCAHGRSSAMVVSVLPEGLWTKSSPILC
jgi:hypothetical protein